MKLKNIEKSELEIMPYDDIAYIILKEKGKKMRTTDVFKIICENLGLSDKEYEEKIGDFFTLLATEKRFIQLDKGFWDLRENHQVKIEIKDDDETDEEILDDDIEEINEDEEFYDDTKEIDDDEADDDLKGFLIVDENGDETDL